MTDENILAFVTESREMIEEVEPSLITLGDIVAQAGTVDDDTTNLIFRLFHSIKGTAGFLQFTHIGQLTHEAETLLDQIRTGTIAFSPSDTDLLCRTCDTLSALLDRIEESESDAGLESEVDKMVAELKARLSGKPDSEEKKAAAPPASAATNGPDTSPDTSPGNPEDTGPPAEGPQLFLTPEMIQSFVQEADEQLDQIESALLALEKNPENLEQVAEAYRLTHSFKGNCGFMGFADLEKLSHKAEAYLEEVKSGHMAADAASIPPLLHIIDVLKNGVIDISNQGPGTISNMAVLLDMMNDLIPVPDLAAEAGDLPEPESPSNGTGEAGTRGPAPPTLPGEALHADDISPEGAALLRTADETEAGPADPDDQPATGTETETEQLADAPVLPGGPETGNKMRSIARQDIRVDLNKLDDLINLVGELVIAESMVRNNPDLTGLELENLDSATAQMNKIVRDLQDIALSVRMLPIAGVFRKMIRLVHDLSNKSGKKVDLQLAGEETEVDKKVSELIADPLVHLVRNAIDHGLETPDQRTAAGKNPVGTLSLEARYEGGEVWITIKDDGQGLSREKILAKAFENGVIQGDGSNLNDQEVYELIFKPGFSTAAEVTDISGRGVGMDVVRKNIEKINGRVDLRSKAGEGSIIILRIPLTLAIIEGMLMRVGSAHYIVSLLSIRESIQVQPEMVTRTMDGLELVKFRGEFVPVIRLHALHNISADNTELVGGLVVIVGTEEASAAIMIDELLGEQQAVIKGLSKYISKIGDIQGVSGCTIQGDGTVSLILDTTGLIKKVQGEKKESQAA